MILSHDQFVSGVHDWASANYHRVELVWPLNGGWEGWLQAELAAYFNDKYDTSSIVREACIYLNSSRDAVDLWINDATATNNADKIAVELKCECLATSKAFPANVEKDALKLQNPFVARASGCQAYVMVFYFSRWTYDRMSTDLYWKSFHFKQYSQFFGSGISRMK